MKVFKLRDSSYLITSGSDKAIACESLPKLIQVMKAIGVRDEEIEYGLYALEIDNYDIAEYGIYKTFIFAKKVA